MTCTHLLIILVLTFLPVAAHATLPDAAWGDGLFDGADQDDAIASFRSLTEIAKIFQFDEHARYRIPRFAIQGERERRPLGPTLSSSEARAPPVL